jgi:hypothetical protein
MSILWDLLFNLGSLLLKVFIIVVPLMVILEISRDYGALGKLTSWLHPFTRRLGLKRESIYPLIAGIIFGISYGGGVLIGESGTGLISGRQMFLVALFLGMCHSIFEDTLLFMSQGANGAVILIVRFILAIVVVSVAAFILKEKGD